MKRINFTILFKKYWIKALLFILATYITSSLDPIYRAFNGSIFSNLKPPFFVFVGWIIYFLNSRIPVYSLLLSLGIVWLSYKIYRYYKVNKRIFKVLNATYGSGNTFVDITDKLNDIVEYNKLKTVLSNALAGDPTPGIKKVGKINYIFNNKTSYKEYEELDTVELP